MCLYTKSCFTFTTRHNTHKTKKEMSNSNVILTVNISTKNQPSFEHFKLSCFLCKFFLIFSDHTLNNREIKETKIKKMSADRYFAENPRHSEESFDEISTFSGSVRFKN